ncbi:hypothetical protein KY284_020214 [Solanum tuberosum]|nr:hypothetical protein KY284_020214 [Solanum tuberosum]
MKDSESIKEYTDRLLNIANHVRLLGSTFNDSRIVENILVIVPERFEATITTLENTKDLSSITLTELLSAFQAQEQRHVIRQEGALPAKHQDDGRYNKKKNKKYQPTDGEGAAHNNKNKRGSDTYLSSVGEGLKLSAQQDVDARVVNEQEKEQLFVASCFSSNVSSESWLIDSGCTNHMTHDKELFKELKPTRVANVRIGHGGHIPVKGMGTIAVET